MDTKSIMYAAHDPAGHTLCYGFVAKGWMLESRMGLIRIMPNLVRGLSELERVSGIPADHFRITENPYEIVLTAEVPRV